VIGIWAVSFSLILARVATFVGILPLLGGRNVPRTVKAGLALALTVMWFDFSAIPDKSLTDAADISWLAYGLALGREMLLGAILGYAMGLFLVPAHIAGEFITQQMAMSLGNIIDPNSNSSTGVVTQIFELLALLIFFGLDGHHIFLALLQSTLSRWPVGGALPNIPVAQFITGAAETEEWGLMLVAPLAASLFLVTVVLALMSRAAPQLNIFSVGFAVQIGVGLLGTWLLLPDLLKAMTVMWGRLGEFLTRVV
jgi:flagellar biosynthetic protein FliR